jgi:nifR3 family TIM-barrel protein
MVAMTSEIVKSTSLPVTVKTRLGWDDDTKYIENVAERLQDVGIKALSIHGRTRKQMYKGEADWSLIGKIKENPRIKIPIFGNGDIDSPQKAKLYKERYNVDGIMIGRASIGYPWIFNEIKHYLATGEMLDPPSIAQRVEVCKKHFDFSMRWKGDVLGIVEMRRHYSNYFKGVSHFKEYRTRLVTTMDEKEIYAILAEVEAEFSRYEFA